MDPDKAWQYRQALERLVYVAKSEVNRVGAGNPPHGIDDGSNDSIEQAYTEARDAWTALEATLEFGE